MRAGLSRRRNQVIVAALLLVSAVVYAVTSNAAPTIPVPVPIVMVHTESGGVLRDTAVPVGGVPVPIDVDNGSLLGILSPDIDVSVNLISVPDLPNVLVPNIVVARDPLAVIRHTPAPPLSFYAQVAIEDAGTLSRLATIDYGYETPPGARIPPKVTATLLGPIQTGFIDPLKARIDAPGYGGALKFNIRARTKDIDDLFQLKFDPLPDSINIVEDPRDDGLDFTYDHTGPTPDVKLDATADLKSVGSGEIKHIGAVIERLPNHIQASYTSNSSGTVLEYFAGSDLGKPDLEATYRDTLANGTIVADGDARISGLPSHIKATIASRPASDGTTDIDGVDFNVVDGGQIDALDFEFKNFLTNPGNVPEYNLGSEQFVAMSSKRQANGTSLYRATGHLLAIRGGSFSRTGTNHDKLAVSTNLGTGDLPLRGIVDLDNRGAPKADDPKRTKVDATIDPLPQKIDLTYQPSSDTDPTDIIYDFPVAPARPVNADTSALIAKGASSTCGDDQVICAQAAVDNVPLHLEAKLPGSKGTDFSVSHNGPATGSGRPNVRATVDVGPDSTETPAKPRTWAQASLTGVPPEVRGRLDTHTGELTAAEFHGCDWNFSATPAACTDTQNSIGAVDFLVRDQPDRVGLPPRPDTAKQFVTLVSRQKAPEPKHFEVKGHVEQVRNVAFHQLDLVPNDNKTDGVLGAQVELGGSHTAADPPIPFDVRVDTVSDALGEKPDNGPAPVIGDDAKTVSVHVDDLPPAFGACVRSSAEGAPPDLSGHPDDALLKACETSTLTTKSGEPAVTPLSANYSATELDGHTPFRTVVKAHVTSTSPDTGDRDKVSGSAFPATSDLDLTITKVPATLHVDVIPPVTPVISNDQATPDVAGRQLQVRYAASDQIGAIDFALQQRRTTSICGDPRPNRKALCLSGTLANLPAGTDQPTTVTFNPDDRSGDIDFRTAPPTGPDKLSLDDLKLSKISPEATSSPLIMTGDIDGIPPHITGKVQSLPIDGGEVDLAQNPTPTAAEQYASCTNKIDDNGDGKPDAKDDNCKTSLARLTLDACPDGGDCSGIDQIDFTATNALVGDPVPHVPDANPAIPNPDAPKPPQSFSYVRLGDLFRAQGVIRNFRNLTYSHLDHDGVPGVVTSFGAGLGKPGTPSSPLRAYLDSDNGKEVQRLDAVVTHPPKTLGLCLRDKTLEGNLNGSSFCDSPDANADNVPDAKKSAIELTADPNGDAPDIQLRSLLLGKGGPGAEVLAGSFAVDGLGRRIDALVGSDGGTDVDIEGHNPDPSDHSIQDVAHRITFDLRNFNDARTLTGFPWTPLDDGAVDPRDDPRNQDFSDGGRNYIQLAKNFDGTLVASGSIPHIKKVALSPRPCDTSDGLTPPAADFGSDLPPDYKCVSAIAAPGHPLGIAVRTLDAPDGDTSNMDVLSLESGQISSMPDAFEATIAKTPAGDKKFKLCSDVHQAPCQPPLISVHAPNGGSAPTLEARLATGDQADLNSLQAIVPRDAESQALDMEQPPDANHIPAGDGLFPYGARLKVGTNGDTDGTAIRMGLKVKLPQFLDLNPPIAYSCAHLQVSSTDCGNKLVSTDNDKGFEDRDIRIGLVAADDKHFGNPSSSNPYLGQVAMMLQPLSQEDGQQPVQSGTQIVLTGMPDPDGHEPVRGSDADHGVTGGSSVGPENFPCTKQLDPCENDPSYKGFLAPGHLDARVYLRNSYDTGGGSKNQSAYTQVDGRVNAPLSMTLRFNPQPPDPSSDDFDDYKPPENRRDDVLVPETQVTLRNAPSSNNQDAYGKPTFRLRTQLAKKPQTGEDPGFFEKLKKFVLCDPDIGIDVLFANVCLVLPSKPNVRYLDVQLNADPHGPSPSDIEANPNQQWTTSGAARTVDVVGGPFGGNNHAEVRGFTEVNGSGGVASKGQPAQVTPVIDTRLTQFPIGLKAGVSFIFGADVRFFADGDLLLGGGGSSVEGLGFGSDGNHIQLKSEGGGDAVAMTNAEVSEHFAVDLTAWGLGSYNLFDLSSPFSDQPISFRGCGSAGFVPWGDDDELADGPGGDQVDVAATFGAPSSWGGLQNIIFDILGYLGGPVGCLKFSPSTAPLISSGAPAPSYSTPDHPIEDMTAVVTPPAPSAPNLQPPPDADLTVGASDPELVLCGSHPYENVDISGTVRVGAPGETDASGHQCDGTLQLGAENVTIHSGGKITASNLLTGGGGHPASGVGGGGGHAGGGGASGADEASAGAGPGGNPTILPQAGPAADIGSEGRNGSVAAATAGKGGGAIVIAVRDRMTNDGAIDASGGNGGAADLTTGAECATGGGGGSGGAVTITSTLVSGSGSISVKGGDGGAGGFGGGGGSAGRLHIDAVAVDPTTSIDHGNGFDPGNGGPLGTCDPGTDANPQLTGKNGADGSRSGSNPPVLSRATIAPETVSQEQPGAYINQKPKVHVEAIVQDGTLPVQIVLCHKRVDFSNSDPFGPSTDNHSTTITGIEATASCDDPIDFPSGTPDGGHYVDATVDPDNVNLPGVYGFFTYARTASCPPDGDGHFYHWGIPFGHNPPATEFTCVSNSSTPNKPQATEAPVFLEQPSEFLPKGTDKVGYDPSAPPDPTIAHDTSTGCLNVACLAIPSAQLTVNGANGEAHATDDASGSGIRTVECHVSTASDPNLWGDCSSRPSTLSLKDGLNSVDVRLTDLAGNQTTLHDAAGWFVDSKAPEKPNLVANSNDGAGKNGWHKVPPTIRLLQSRDFPPTSGFGLQNADIYVDEGKVKCPVTTTGQTADASQILFVSTTCDPVPDIPGEGHHEISATITDRVGHTSERSDPVDTNVDTTKPSSDIFVGPKTPDGANDWYTTKPFLAFGASDGASGSGMDATKDVDHVGAGIHINIDNHGWETYDPNGSYVLDDGTHSVCWYAVDLAGNREDADPNVSGDQDHCRSGIKVDTTAPVVSDPISPAGPNGNNGYYRTKPVITPDGNDVVPSPGTTISGLDRVEYQVDDGDWTPKAPITVQEGVHTIRVRAFDNAGNAADLHERTVMVDLTKPSAALFGYPPNANAQGWFRQPRTDVVTARDERDGSGVDSATYLLDGGSHAYTAPFTVPVGPSHSASATPKDRAGNVGAVTPVQSSKIDTTAPTAAPSPVQANTLTLLRSLLGALLPALAPTTLAYTTGDDLSSRVKVTVNVFDQFETRVKTIPVNGPFPGGYSATGPGSVQWNGTNDAGKGVLPGVYHYRITAVDQAGNTVSSTESLTFLVVVGLLPL